MVLFRRNKPAPASAAGLPVQPNLAVLKRQAKQRLLGATLLIVLGVALFAWVLKDEPRIEAQQLSYSLQNKGAQVQESTVEVAAPAPSSVANTAEAGVTSAPSADTKANERRWAFGLQAGEEVVDEAETRSSAAEAAQKEREAQRRRVALEQEAKIEKERLAQERAEKDKAAKAEKERLAKEQAEKDKAAKAKADKERQERLAKEQAEKDKAAKAKAEADRARALLEGAPSSASSKASERKIVQFGTFSDPAKAAEVRRKVEAAGIKTYTQEIDTPRGRMIRLRVGPFTQEGEAEAVEKRIKALGLSTAILTL